MSNSESFIQEVTEEVRRDRLYGLFRKYGWIGAVAILAIVGGTAFVSWQKAQQASLAQGFGDQLLEALDTGTPEGRLEALQTIEATDQQAVIRDFIIASDPSEHKAESLTALDRVIADTKLSPVWRDLAILRRVSVIGSEQPIAERRAALEPLAAPGRPYRALVAEQLAYLLIEEGRIDEAITALNALTNSVDATAALKSRAGQIVTALGGKPILDPVLQNLQGEGPLVSQD